MVTFLVFPQGDAHHPQKHGLGHTEVRVDDKTQHLQSVMIRPWFVSLFALTRAAQYARVIWHRAQGAFIPRGAIGGRCIMVMCGKNQR